MKRAVSSIVVVAATLVCLSGLFALQPFARMSDGLDRVFSALPAWTARSVKVSEVFSKVA